MIKARNLKTLNLLTLNSEELCWWKPLTHTIFGFPQIPWISGLQIGEILSKVTTYFWLIVCICLDIHMYIYLCVCFVCAHLCMHIHTKILIIAAEQFDCSLPRLTALVIQNGMEKESTLWANALTNVMRRHHFFSTNLWVFFRRSAQGSCALCSNQCYLYTRSRCWSGQAFQRKKEIRHPLCESQVVADVRYRGPSLYSHMGSTKHVQQQNSKNSSNFTSKSIDDYRFSI